MTQRERHLLLVVLMLGGFLLLVGGYFGLQSIVDGFYQHQTQVAALKRDVEVQERSYRNLLLAQAKVEQWRAISLPADRSLANSRYVQFLKELCARHQLSYSKLSEGGNLRSAPALGRGGEITPLTFEFNASGTLERLIGFLKEFYALNLPHVIRKLDVTSQGAGENARLDLSMKIEVLSMPTATNRDYLVAVPDSRVLALDVFMAMKHGPIGLGLAPWLISPTGLHGARKLASLEHADRDYAKLVAKNVFIGLAPRAATAAVDPKAGDREVLKYVQLIGIFEDFLKTEAMIRNRLTGKYTRLRAEGGWDSFTIHDANDREVLKGRVKQIDGRDLVFQVDEKFYRLHLGEFMEQALRNELTAAQMKELGMGAAAPVENP